jgi:hypothetical protein
MALGILEKGCKITFVDRRRILAQAATGFWFDLILVCTNNELGHIFKILHHQILDSLKSEPPLLTQRSIEWDKALVTKS